MVVKIKKSTTTNHKEYILNVPDDSDAIKLDWMSNARTEVVVSLLVVALCSLRR